ncbi:MAG: HAD family hydrolase [Candidatus Nealsonbacteria bacterium]|nr:HAD family hydrolase [Candidatus Nealsonbacteria bacterium]
MPADYREEDYRPVEAPDSTYFLSGTRIEIIRPLCGRQRPRHVLFDFDGTLSLIREGWPDVMVPMMVEVLRATGTDESPETLRELVIEFVMQLNGKQTIYQMIRLAEEVRRRGGRPEDPLAYKQIYHERLMERIDGRRDALRCGEVSPQQMLVPHSLEILDAFRQRGVQLYVASGTDERYVLEEARLLGLDAYFGRHIYGAQDDYRAFSKAKVIERILTENNVDGASLAGFGDGYVEIQNIRAVGGTAVAVASDESGRSGKADPWKRDRLIGVGAHLVIPDYRDGLALLDYLWDKS